MFRVVKGIGQSDWMIYYIDLVSKYTLVARKWLLDDVFINRICNETFGTPSEGITLITLLNRYSTTLRRDFNDVLTMQSTQFLMKYSTTLRRDLSLLSVVE